MVISFFMQDISLLIVRPEVRFEAPYIEVSLQRRGYDIVQKERRTDWWCIAQCFYGNQLDDTQLQLYLSGHYALFHGFGFNFLAWIVEHKEGGTLERLAKDKGHLYDYQDRGRKDVDTTSLRAEFGFGRKLNVPYPLPSSNGYTFAPYCGFHAPSTKEELENNLEILGLTRFASRNAL
jgi:hypothetical protein